MMYLEWEMIVDSNIPRDFLQCMGSIKVAWAKLKVFLKSDMWKKRVFQ